MYRITVSYDHPSDPDAMVEHYRSTHAPLAQKMPGIEKFSWGVCESLDGSQPPHFIVAAMDYPSKDAALASLGSPEGQAAVADMEVMPHNGFSMNAFEVLA